MIFQRWTGPPADTHTYLLGDEESREAWAIDAPLQTAAVLLDYARRESLEVRMLVLTHGHFDHILDVPRYQEAGIPVAAHPHERAIFDAPQTELFGLPYAMPAVTIDKPLEEGDLLRLGTQAWTVWHVPGHSPGHILLYGAEASVLFGGDLLFHGGYGRVDLPGTDAAQMSASLRRLLALPAETRIYPGHGPDTTLAAERPWLAPLLGTPGGLG